VDVRRIFFTEEWRLSIFPGMRHLLREITPSIGLDEVREALSVKLSVAGVGRFSSSP
jgi:hypothetical protein